MLAISMSKEHRIRTPRDQRIRFTIFASSQSLTNRHATAECQTEVGIVVFGSESQREVLQLLSLNPSSYLTGNVPPTLRTVHVQCQQKGQIPINVYHLTQSTVQRFQLPSDGFR